MVTAEGFGVAPEGRREEVGRLLACRAAVTDAQRNLVEATKGVRVTVSTSVSKFAADYDTVKTAVDGSIQGATILSRDMGEDSTCKVTMGLFVSGQLSNSIYQTTLPDKNIALLHFKRFLDSIFPMAYAQDTTNNPFGSSTSEGPWIDDYQKLDERVSKLESSVLSGDPIMSSAREEEQPTGLIIDVRGHRFLPSMTPEIMRPEGSVIYPSSDNKEAIVKSGKLLSLFSRSLDFALNHPIVGDRPLLIKGQSNADKATSILLTENNAQRLDKLAKLAFFSQPNVIIVLD